MVKLAGKVTFTFQHLESFRSTGNEEFGKLKLRLLKSQVFTLSSHY